VEKGFKESDYIFDDTFTTQVRHPSVAHIKTGVKRDGTILAREVKFTMPQELSLRFLEKSRNLFKRA